MSSLSFLTWKGGMKTACLTGMLKEFKRGKSLCEDRHVRALRKCLGVPVTKASVGLEGPRQRWGTADDASL